MRFAAGLVALLPLVSASVILKRTDNSAAIQKNITTIDNDVKTLNSTLNQNDNNTPYNFFQLGAINVQSQQISTDVNSTAATANSSDVATASESQAILNQIQTMLQPDIFSLLNNLVAHKPAFDQGGISPTVLNTLQQQRELTRELGNALTAKADPAYRSKAASVSSSILSRFDGAIKSYSS